MEYVEQLEYLLKGGARQQEVYRVIKHYCIFSKIATFDPDLVGSIPLGIDIEGSDVDIICSYVRKSEFIEHLDREFGSEQGFTQKQSEMYGFETVTVNFWVEGLHFEIFGQMIPTREQLGYRHMIIEAALLKSNGSGFRNDVIALKKQGFKTEAAFCKLLEIEGNPYLQLLKLEE